MCGVNSLSAPRAVHLLQNEDAENPMPPIRIKTRVESDTLILPELRTLIGKVVEIRVTEEAEPATEPLLDTDYHAECAADAAPEVPLAEVRAGLSSIPGSMTADYTAERDER
jgi:hypothetical protein